MVHLRFGICLVLGSCAIACSSSSGTGANNATGGAAGFGGGVTASGGAGPVGAGGVVAANGGQPVVSTGGTTQIGPSGNGGMRPIGMGGATTIGSGGVMVGSGGTPAGGSTGISGAAGGGGTSGGASMGGSAGSNSAGSSGAGGTSGGGSAQLTGMLGSLGAVKPTVNAWVISNSGETLIYLSSAPLTCMMMQTMGLGWLPKVQAGAQVIEVVIKGAPMVQTYPVGFLQGEVNYAPGGMPSSYETTAQSGSIMITKATPNGPVEGSIMATYATGSVMGMFHAEFCQMGSQY